MIKNKKAQVSVIVMVFGMILIAALLISLSLASNQLVRSANYINNKQLDNLVEGGVYASMAVLKEEIDYIGDIPFPNKEYHGVDHFMLNDKEVSINSRVSLYKEGQSEFHGSTNHEIYEVGSEAKKIEFYVNHAEDVCFEVQWDNNARMRLTLYKNSVKEANIIGQTPDELDNFESNSGLIGKDLDECNTSNPVRLTSDDIYDISEEPRLKNGYGKYIAVVEKVSGPDPINLRTKVLYNRLDYRTFAVDVNEVKYGNATKNDTRVIIRAEYNKNNHSDTSPKFEYLKWIEKGDEINNG